jgi:DNA-binding NtrC family response regulator
LHWEESGNFTMTNSVLLVDDEHTFRETVATFLREEGIAVTAVSSGADALLAIAKHSYPVAILDILMPQMDGISLLREIKKIRPATNVIMITAGGTAQIAAEATRLGACDYLIKPVQFEQILNKIKHYLPAENFSIEIPAPQDAQKIENRGLDTENLREATREFERKYITNVLEKCHFDKARTAKVLGVGLSSLYRKIEELDIDVEKKSDKNITSASNST